MSSYKTYYLALALTGLLFTGCVASKPPDNTESNNSEITELSSEEGASIMQVASREQKNEMYSPQHDSTLLYWLNDRLLVVKNSTKCNIFALNTLYKAGCKCPDVNVLTHDLVDETRFNDIFPVVNISDYSEIKKGDLVVWDGHVILFEKLVKTKTAYYAQAWWAGTRQSDNGENILNNVIYGKYPLKGTFIVRRPVKK